MELRKYTYERLDGSVRAEERFAAIRSFSRQSVKRGSDSEPNQNDAFVFMISTRAGGVGLNLVSADTVIFYEQDWNPQVDKQALQRAHRIGQMNHVLAINLVTRRTVEEVIMRRAERKLQLSYNVVGEMDNDQKGNEMEVDKGDLRSVIFGLQMFDFTNVNEESSNEVNLEELSDMTKKLIERRHDASAQIDSKKFEVDPVEFFKGSDNAATNLDPGLDESSYLSWVEKFKEASQLVEEETKNLSEEKQKRHEVVRKKTEEERKKAEEEKIRKWEALGYQSLAIEAQIGNVQDDMALDSGSVEFVYGDCTHPSSIGPSEAAIIFSCVDNSGNWGHGGMFSALVKLSPNVPEAYERASQFKDLHMGDLHLIKVSDEGEENGGGNTPQWVALAVVQSYNAKRKVPRSDISIPNLESCLLKASYAASQNSASIHMPRIGYQSGSDRSEWYTVERLLKKYASMFGIKIFVYYYRRSS